MELHEKDVLKRIVKPYHNIKIRPIAEVRVRMSGISELHEVAVFTLTPEWIQ